MLSLIATLPATLLLPFLAENKVLKVDTLSGTIWHGYAQQIRYQKSYRLSDLEWSLNVWSLLALKLNVDVKFANSAPRFQGKGQVSLSLTEANINHLTMNLEATEVSPYLALPIPIETQGDIQLVIQQATFEGLNCKNIDASVTWQDARISSDVGNINLANVDVDLSCARNSYIAEVLQVSSDLKTEIRIDLKTNGSYTLTGNIKEGTTLAKNIQQGLSFLGKKEPNGSFALSFNGRL
ncbi:type II secretion system protein N [Psychromonas sp. CD1]|uniref:type II secretion system protein N n=1 Tax=Psychromonas sp. CD1 TaxID=1979839 RepID=UPI0015D9D5E9|nr:type II secretion system protein N [Psychromonas sp. CD1]